jgi:hypothetical protein
MTNNSTPLSIAPVYLFNSTHSKANINFIEKQLGIEIKTCSMVGELGEAFSTSPNLLVFHINFMNTNQDSTVGEFIQMVRTLGKYTDGAKYCSIGVIINKETTWEQVKELKQAEIQGIIPSPESFGMDDAVKSLKLLLEKRPYWPKYILDQLQKSRRITRTSRTGIELTHRQKQVLDLVCNRGLSNKKIALALKISESTVKIHISAILRQYQVRNRTQLALAAKDHFKR